MTATASALTPCQTGNDSKPHSTPSVCKSASTASGPAVALFSGTPMSSGTPSSHLEMTVHRLRETLRRE
eukprot:scaffold329077_cov34-Prasinocladus_malaysianus.AAC.1